jgi:hypothetical protein
MADETQWTERSWPGIPRRIIDHATARALVPDATDDGHEGTDAWFLPIPGGTAAVAKNSGSIHETSEQFGTVKEAAASFRTYWPAGLAAEHQAALDLAAYFAAKRGESVVLNYRPDPTEEPVLSEGAGSAEA